MKKRVFSVGFSIVFLIALVGSAVDDRFTQNPFYNGDIQFSLDKPSYMPGESLSVSFVASNFENFSVVDANIIVHLVSGGTEHIYPSQSSDNDSVLYEGVIEDINLAPMESKTVNYSYELPDDLKSGSYRLEAYLETERTPLVGMAAIFLAPKTWSFEVSGKGVFPEAKILRNDTVFNNESGPIGVGVPPGAEVKGLVYVQSLVPDTLDGYYLDVSVCEWQDMVCPKESVLFEKRYDMPVLSPGGKSKVEVEFTSPVRPEAYSVRLELKDRNGRTNSLYRSRIVVVGPTGRIRKMALDHLDIRGGDAGKILLLVGASPDHYLNPSIENVKVSASLYDKAGAQVYTGSFTIDNLSAENNGGYVARELEFHADRDLPEYRVCSKLESSAGELLDQYCFDVDPSKYSTLERENVYNVSWDYVLEKSELAVDVCVRDPLGRDSQAESMVMLLSPKTASAQYKNVSAAPCARQSFKAEPGAYVLAVNDLGSNKQYSFDLDLTKSSKEAVKETTTSLPQEKEEPVATTSSTMPETGSVGTNYLPAGLAALALVLVIIYLLRRRPGKTEKNGGESK